jgi:inorganic triphosphatase YgiF
LLNNTFEIETKLAIIHSEPEEISEQIAREQSLGHYILEPAPQQAITDRYFDTADHFLRGKGLALRYRLRNEESLVTLKGKSRIETSGAIRRMEIEEHWSESALHEIMEILSYIGLNLKEKTHAFNQKDPVLTFKKLGFILLQERTTQRQVRMIKNPQNSREKAELAIDRTVYQFQNNILRHYEIEIEEKSDDAATMVEQCIKILHSSYPQALKSWKINKLALGLILEKLVENPQFQKLIQSDDRISPEGYRFIEAEAGEFKF